MGMNDTPSAQRIHIGFFGKRNSGKSSLVNAVTGQALAVVSDIAGTTTDPVQKAMELAPIGPVVIIDTPGFDDDGALGQMRVEKTFQTLNKTDIAVVVLAADREPDAEDGRLLAMLEEKQIPVLIAINKTDKLADGQEETVTERWGQVIGNRDCVPVSAKEGIHITQLKEAIARLAAQTVARAEEKPLAADLVSEGDFVILVTPIDRAAPKGRLILPQQQTIRDLLEKGAVPIVTKETQLAQTLREIGKKPRLVITDSQAFSYVDKIVPGDIPLTSFSMLFARYKGQLRAAVEGARLLDTLHDGDKVLLCEGCTHHRQCEDIGTVKLPRWLAKYTGKSLELAWTSGTEFPKELTEYRLVIHCGGCMLNEKEMRSRSQQAAAQGIAMTNYGTAIAYMNGILERALKPLEGKF